MIHTLFADPQVYMTPESIVAEYFNHLEDAALLVGCARCGSLHTMTVEIETRRLMVCHECGEVAEAPHLN